MSISNNSQPCICRYFRQKSANRAMSSMLACFRKWKEHLPYISKFEMSHLHVTMSLSLSAANDATTAPCICFVSILSHKLSDPCNFFYLCVVNKSKQTTKHEKTKVQPRVSSPFQTSQILNRNKTVYNALERNLKLSEHTQLKMIA